MTSTEPTKTNNDVSNPPPYPVEGSSTIVDPPAPDPYTADLISAVQYGYYDRVVELIESNPNLALTPMTDNVTLLHWAAINNRVEIAEYLLSKGAEIDAHGGELNSTPLHWATRNGKLQMVVCLLSHHAQTSLFDREGFSSLHLACIFGHTDIAAYLIAKGHDVDYVDRHGMSPLMRAVNQIRKREPTQLLIRLGAEVNRRNPQDNSTPLHYAILASNTEAIRLLLDAGANIDLRNADNESPYDLVTQRKQYRHLFGQLALFQSSHKNLPSWLQVNSTSRRLGTKFLPYLVMLLVAVTCQLNVTLISKAILIIAMILLTKGYTIIFFDKNLDRYLPMAIAQASICWLYVCYGYYFLPYVHLLSVPFVSLVICTYFSWWNYYSAHKCDPGAIRNNREQQYQNIIQLVEQNQFDLEHFCTWCLIKRPLRSKHCRECQRCIAKFDHHCPWIDNCVGENNLQYFAGFLFFTPLCLCLYLHGAYLYYRDHCHIFASETVIDIFRQMIHCSPAILWFTAIALLHTIWTGGLCITILIQIATGYTTNEKMNAWRYAHLKSQRSSPFSLGCIQNLVDLIRRRIFWYIPINLDWTNIYSLDEFNQSISSQLRPSAHRSTMNSPMSLLHV